MPVLRLPTNVDPLSVASPDATVRIGANANVKYWWSHVRAAYAGGVGSGDHEIRVGDPTKIMKPQASLAFVNRFGYDFARYSNAGGFEFEDVEIPAFTAPFTIVRTFFMESNGQHPGGMFLSPKAAIVDASTPAFASFPRPSGSVRQVHCNNGVTTEILSIGTPQTALSAPSMDMLVVNPATWTFKMAVNGGEFSTATSTIMPGIVPAATWTLRAGRYTSSPNRPMIGQLMDTMLIDGDITTQTALLNEIRSYFNSAYVGA